MTPCPGGEPCYKSKYWPSLNGLSEESTFFYSSWDPKSEPLTERESTLLDVIGAYDLLLLQGLTAQGALTRLDLHKTRDQLVEELDFETGRRLSLRLLSPPEQRPSGARLVE